MNSTLNFAKYVDHPYYQDKLKCIEILQFQITESMLTKPKKPYYQDTLHDLMVQNPIIKKEALWMLFLKYNLLKKRLNDAQEIISIKYDSRLEKLINEYIQLINDIQHCIAKSNIRLAYIASKSLKINVNDYMSTVYIRLLRCVEIFDVSKGFAFSTYATLSIFQNFRSDILKEFKHQHSEIPEVITDPKQEDISAEIDKNAISQMVKNSLEILDCRESTVIRSYFGIDCDPKNLAEIGKDLRLSKEYIRQVKAKALKKLKNNIRFAPV